MKTTMIATLTLLCFGAYAQHDQAGHSADKTEQAGAKFKDEKLGAAYDHYTHLKDALVASNAQDAKKDALELQKSLAKAGGSKKVVDAAAKVAVTADLGEQRKAFSTLSNEMKTLVKDGKLSSGALYVEYCPMANNSEGAFWLSNEKQIRNPYFGDAMLKCGSVKETIQ